MQSKLFKGIFNYFGQNFVLYSHASTYIMAYYNFCSQIGKKAGVGRKTVMQRFDGSRDNYHIEEVKE